MNLKDKNLVKRIFASSRKTFFSRLAYWTLSPRPNNRIKGAELEGR